MRTEILERERVADHGEHYQRAVERRRLRSFWRNEQRFSDVSSFYYETETKGLESV